MTRIKLRGRETERRGLPMVCMMCGEPAEERLRKRFSWHPPWVIVLIFAGLLPYVIVALTLTKYHGVDVPVCSRHKHYWMKKFGIFLGSFLALGAAMVGWFILAFTLEEDKHVNLGGLVCGLPLVGILLWFAGVFALQFFALRPVEITDRSITMANVSPEFIEAVEDEREARAARRERDDDRAPRQPSRRDAEIEDEPPKRRESSRERREPDEPRRRRRARDED